MPPSPAAPFNRPLPFSRPGHKRRIEVFSPKLSRRLSLSSYDAWRTWLALEANPAVLVFCERPCRIAGPKSATVDFWVRLQGSTAGEFWLLADPAAVGTHGSGTAATTPTRLHNLPVRPVCCVDLAAWSVPLANWAHIVQILVSYRRFRDQLLEQSLVVFLGSQNSLDTIARRFAEYDGGSVEAALFWLVAGGRVVSPDLALAPLSGATRFRRR